MKFRMNKYLALECGNGRSHGGEADDVLKREFLVIKDFIKSVVMSFFYYFQLVLMT